MRLVLVIFLLLLSPMQAFAQANGTATPPAGSPAPETVAQPSPAAPSSGAAAVSTSILPKDLSVWGMFMAADWLVQAVMVGLAVASVVTWTV
ncbi:MAG TPA: tonB-system energizer ExbB, partial [Reyranella sp.]|nr:tonB-system energizer ExbB [Reyranella sp.]